MVETTRKQILLVEDDRALAETMKRVLEFEGFEVAIEATGASALARAAEARPDVIILDLKLPDIHGYQVCKELRKLYHYWVVPVLMLTGMDQPIDQLRGFAYGADAYLTKPCDSKELLKTIHLLLGELSVA